MFKYYIFSRSLLIASLKIISDPIFEDKELVFSPISLFTGKNGSGKSLLSQKIDQLAHRSIQQKSILLFPQQIFDLTIIDESRKQLLPINSAPITERRNEFSSIIVDMYLERLNKKLKQDSSKSRIDEFNEIFYKLFKRKLILPDTFEKNISWVYEKDNGIQTRPIDDGFGIGAVFVLLAYLLKAKTGDIFVIEEPTIGINPSQVKNIFLAFLEIQKRKKIQIIFISHDILFRTEFFRYIEKEPQTFSLFGFKETSEKIQITQYSTSDGTKKKFQDEFIDEFIPSESDIDWDKWKEIYSLQEEENDDNGAY